jgi:hypothetical protein
MLQSGATSDETLPSLKSHHRRVIRFVAGGIAMHRGEQGDNPQSGINIEELFTAVKMLADRDTLEIAPFVAQWHNAVEVIDNTVRYDSSLNEWSLEVAIREALEVAIRAANDEYEIDSLIWDDSRDIESNLGMAANELRRKIDEYLSGGERGWTESAFEDTVHQMTVALKDLVWLVLEHKTDYFGPLVEASAEHNATIATLNYDNTIELAAARFAKEVDVGLESWRQEGTISKPAVGIELLKLHGSIDWEMSSGQVGQSDQDDESLFRLQKVSQIDMDNFARRFSRESALFGPPPELGLIFGAGNKLTEKGPFLELFRTFERRLESHDRLVTIGYSFGDQHINHVIFRWMNQKPERKLTVVDREGITTDSHRLWRDNPAVRRSERVELLSVGAKQGITDLFSEHNCD